VSLWQKIKQMIKKVIIKVKGKVQGVGFRYYTLNTAKENNIKGFVRNQADGSVYIEAVGNINDIDLFIDWCKLGPQWANVTNVLVSESEIGNYSKFEIK